MFSLLALGQTFLTAVTDVPPTSGSLMASSLQPGFLRADQSLALSGCPAAVQPPHWRDQGRTAEVDRGAACPSHVCLNAWSAAVFEAVGPLQGGVSLEEVGHWGEGQEFIT